MSDTSFRFVDISDAQPRAQQQWPSVIVPKEAIDSEVERLAAAPPSESGRRESLIAHPLATEPGLGFAPGIDVSLSVLKPGEQSAASNTNASRIDMCIRGRGRAKIGPATHSVEQFDVWNTPSLDSLAYENDGSDLFVRLSFSNRPVLEKLEVYFVDDVSWPVLPPTGNGATGAAASSHARDIADSIPIGSEGALLLGYEYLIDIDVVESKPLLWPWREVNQHLRRVYERDTSYSGRHLYLLYNPATGRRMGTSPTLFATIAKYPPGKVDRIHRHTSAAINYYFDGHGKSEVGGRKMEWKAGDLHLSAPGWAMHHHASREQGFCALTIQDHPLHLAMESLMWQESTDAPIVKLGARQGIETNLSSLARA